MVNTKYTVANQLQHSIGYAKKFIALLGCFYLSTAFTRACMHSNTRPKQSGCKSVGYIASYNHLNEDLLEKALKGERDAIATLAEWGKKIDAKDLFKPGYLRIAIVKNSSEGSSLLLEYARKGILSSKTQPTEQSITLMVSSPIDATALPSSYETVMLLKQLVAYGVGLDGLNRWGETLLTEVIKHGASQNQLALIELLLKAGANPNGLNGKQQLPLGVVKQIKKSQDRKKIIKLLMSYGGNPLLASMDQETQAYVRDSIIGQLKKVDLALSDPIFSKILTKIDARLQLFFNQKYNKSDIVVSGQKALACVVCAKKETEATTIQIPLCGHYVHGSCLARSLINMKSKGEIKWLPRPSYLYTHLCPCCKKPMENAFIKDLNLFYEGIKFRHMALTLALRIAFAIPCITVIPGGFVLLAGLFWPTPDT